VIDIQAGDVVVCVNVDPAPYWGPPPLTLRAVYRVEDVLGIDDGDGVGIVIQGVSAAPCLAFYSYRFKKLPKADESFTQQIRACRPIKRGVDA
jgi:hypothetical protein